VWGVGEVLGVWCDWVMGVCGGGWWGGGGWVLGWLGCCGVGGGCGWEVMGEWWGVVCDSWLLGVGGVGLVCFGVV